MSIDCGPVRRWIEGGILYAENDFVRVCWGPTDDPAQVGKLGFYGPKEICVEFVLRSDFETACKRATEAA